MTTEEQEELQYLRFFYEKADFGPAHEDVVSIVNDEYLDEYGSLPAGYNLNED